jgi:uncharacterized repeat protein (TIGR02543 family)
MGGGAALVEFRIGYSTVKTLTLEIPEGEESILLPEEALPTEENLAEYGLRVEPAMTNPIEPTSESVTTATNESVITGEAKQSSDETTTVNDDSLLVIPAPEPESLTNQILGWVDTKDKSKTIYTTDENLYETEGYAPISEFIVYGDTTFEAVTLSNKDEIAGQARNDKNVRNDADDTDNESSVIPTSEPESTPISAFSQTSGDDKLTFMVGTTSGFVDVDDIGNAVNWAQTDNRQIQITAEFSEINVAKDRTITVTIPRGYKIIEYTAKDTTPVISGVNKLELSPVDEAKVASASLTALDGTSSWADQRINGYTGGGVSYEFAHRNYDGRVTYTFNKNCDRIVLTLTLGIDQELISHKTATAPLDDIVVDMQSGTVPLQDSLATTVTAIPTVIISQSFGSNSSISNIEGVVDAIDSDTGTASFPTGIRYNNRANSNHKVDSQTIVVSYPEGATFNHFIDHSLAITSVAGSSTGSFANGHLVVVNNPSARTVTFTYSNITTAYPYELIFYWDVIVDNDKIKWDDTLAFPATFTETSGLLSGYQDTYGPDSYTNNKKIMKPQSIMSLTALGLTKRDLNAQGDYPYSYALGGFNLVNAGPSVAQNLTYTFTFSPNLRVRAVSFGAYAPLSGWDITATTNLRPITLTNTTLGDGGLGPVLRSEKLGLQSGEYLTALTAHSSSYTIGGSYSNQETNRGIYYYGRFQGGQTGDVTLSVTADGGISMSKTDHTIIGWTGTLGTTNNALNVSHSSTSQVSGSFYPSDAMYFTSTVYAGDAMSSTNPEIVDPDVYIILPKGIDLDLGSVTALSVAGNHGNTRFSLIPAGSQPKTVSGVEWIAYKFQVPAHQDIIANSLNMGGTEVPKRTFNVKFTANVSSACSTYPQLQAADIVKYDLGKTVSQGSGRTTDVNDWAGHGTSYYLATSYNSPNFAVVQKPGLNVYLGIRVAGTTTPYYTYNGTEATIAPVTPSNNAEVWLKYENTSSDVYYTGSEIYLPIPKKELYYDHYFNNKANDPYNNIEAASPQWTGLLTGPVTPPAGFDVLYTTNISAATNYTAGELPSGWTPFSGPWVTSVADYSQVTMLKFVANTNIDAGTSGETSFEIEVASAAELGQTDYWRSYQKGWGSVDGNTNSTWVYGSVIAAQPAMAGVKGIAFYDADADGIMDADEDFDGSVVSALTGTRATLTGSGIPLLNITVNPDGTFASLDADGTTPYYLKAGTYTLTFYDDNAQRGFTTETGATRSNTTGTGPSAVDHWYMDIDQANVAGTHASATFTFTVSSSTLSTQLVGVGLKNASLVTYHAGAGASFTPDVTEYKNHNQRPSSNIVPSFSQGNRLPGYNPATERWISDVELKLGDSPTATPAGTKLTRAQVLSAHITEATTFTATLALSEYTVNYNKGTVDDVTLMPTPNPKTNVHFSDVVRPATDPKRPGYTFAGWDVTEGGSGTDISSSATYSDLVVDDTVSAITLTAQWNIDNYHLIYDENTTDITLTGSVPVDTANYHINEGAALAGNDNSLDRIGYTFKGWSATRGGTTPITTVTFGSPTFPLGDITVYAIWNANSYPYTITHHFVSGSKDGTVIQAASSNQVFGQTVTASPTSYAGYSHNASHPQAVPSGVIGVSGLELHLYYQANSYTVSYAAGGSNVTGLPGDATQYMDDSYMISTTKPSRSGYTFNGWVATSGISGNYSGGNSFIMPASNVVLTASWTVIPTEPPIVTPATYTVSYDGGGDNVTGLPSDATLKEGDKYTVSGNIPERAGYTFNGWISTSGISGNYSGGNSFTMPASNVVLTASWKVVPPVINPPVVEHPTATEPPVVTPVSVIPPATLTSEEEPIAEPEVTPPNASVVPDPVEPEVSKPDATFNGAVKDENIPKIGVPLYGPKGFDAWSLLDLILMLIGVILTVITIIGAIRRSRKDDDELDYRTFEDDGEKKKNTKMLFVIIMSILTVASVILFVLTQDVTLPMVWLDKWTIVFAVVLIAQIVARKFSRKTEKDEEEAIVA